MLDTNYRIASWPLSISYMMFDISALPQLTNADIGPLSISKMGY